MGCGGKAAVSWGAAKGAVAGAGGAKAKGATANKGAALKGGKALKAGKPKGDHPPSSEEVEGVTDRKFTGTLKSFNEGTGFGFIDCPELKEIYGNDVFVHRMQVEGVFTPNAGMSLTFGVFLNKDGKPQAKDITTGGGAKRPRT